MIVRPAPPEHYCWIAERAKLIIGPEFRAIEAIEDLNGAEGPVRVVGACGYDGWTPNAVCMHVAFDSPIAMRALLKVAFKIAFLECNREVVLGTVLGTNEKALKLDKHLGFKEVGRVRDGWDKGCDLILLSMHRDECRWLRNESSPVGDNAREVA